VEYHAPDGSVHEISGDKWFLYLWNKLRFADISIVKVSTKDTLTGF
jgi:hypothetical protein